MPAAVEVELRGVALQRGTARPGQPARMVLAGVDLAIARGEQVALVGGNGAGKTTLLRAMAGLDAPAAGRIAWRGATLPRGAARVRQVGLLLQAEAGSPFRVAELVGLGLGLDGPPGPAARAAIAAALQRQGLEALAGRRCDSLSGGELQRVALARATVGDPGLLLLDEPTTHLDPGRQAELLSWLERERGGPAIVIATHDLALAARCDRVVLIGGGGVQAAGAPREVLTAERLGGLFGVQIRRVDDPRGGPPFLRVEAVGEIA
jgi:iron complex transport system ATP-binding protein